MKIGLARIASLSISGMMVFLLLIYVGQGFTMPSAIPVTREQMVRQEVGTFLITFRVLEFLGIAFLVLAVVACCGAMLRKEIGET